MILFQKNGVIVTNNTNTQVDKGYTIYINVSEVRENIIKQIDIQVKYKLGGKVKTVSMSTLINK